MTVWKERPTESANLFNPAFCGEIVRLCIKSYVKETGRGSPYPLSFLVLPTLMYSETRETMAARKYTFLYNWLQEHPYLRVNFAHRARELLPTSKEAVAFLLQIGALTLDDEAGLRPTQYRRKSLESQKQTDIKDFYNKAELLGKWFAKAGDVATIYALWGIKP